MVTRDRRYKRFQPSKSDADEHNERHTNAIFGGIEKEAETLSQFFTDPLCEGTKNTRRTLLLTAFISIIVSTTGLLPKKISALGLELQDIDQKSLLIILLLTVAYLLLSFLFYAYSDLVRTYWRTIYFFKVALPELENTEMYIQHAVSASSKKQLNIDEYINEEGNLRSIVEEARQATQEINRIREEIGPIFRDIKWANLRTLLKKRLMPLLPARSASCRWRADAGPLMAPLITTCGHAGPRGISLLKKIHVIRIAVDTALPLMVGLASILFLIAAILKR